jgi:hypothetical protein
MQPAEHLPSLKQEVHSAELNHKSAQTLPLISAFEENLTDLLDLWVWARKSKYQYIGLMLEYGWVLAL